jgi:hypothetical protein
MIKWKECERKKEWPTYFIALAHHSPGLTGKNHETLNYSNQDPNTKAVL